MKIIGIIKDIVISLILIVWIIEPTLIKELNTNELLFAFLLLSMINNDVNTYEIIKELKWKKKKQNNALTVNIIKIYVIVI